MKLIRTGRGWERCRDGKEFGGRNLMGLGESDRDV